jgi:hypothetical protein
MQKRTSDSNFGRPVLSYLLWPTEQTQSATLDYSAGADDDATLSNYEGETG